MLIPSARVSFSRTLPCFLLRFPSSSGFLCVPLSSVSLTTALFPRVQTSSREGEYEVCVATQNLTPRGRTFKFGLTFAAADQVRTYTSSLNATSNHTSLSNHHI